MGKSYKVWSYGKRDGPSYPLRSVLQVRHEVQRSSPSTQIPRVQVFWNRDPRRTVVPDDLSYIPSRVMKRAEEEIAQVWDD